MTVDVCLQRGTNTRTAAVGSMTDMRAGGGVPTESCSLADRPTARPPALRQSLSGPVGGDAEVAGECFVAVLGEH
jgi:hypothetical protein